MEVRFWRHVDIWLLLTTLALLVFGVGMVYSATLHTEDIVGMNPRVFRHAIYIAVGLALMVAMMTVNYEVLGNVAIPTYLVMVSLLLLVVLLGRILHGSQRWIQLGFIDLQPSELGKLLIAITLARYVADRQDEIHSFRLVLTTLAIALVPAGLTLIQPDFGTSTLFLVIWLGIMLLAGIRWRHLMALVVTVMAVMPLAWLLLHDYQRNRLLIFLDPHRDPLGQGYNIIQALISVGSGGLLGRGFASGTQSQLHFLRVRYADFIFSVAAEELGFVGVMVLMMLFATLLLRGLRSVTLSPELFGRLLGAGIVSWLSYQFFINVGMNVGLVPVTGIPLPLISYGGSSLLTVLAALGVLQSIAMRHRRFEL